MKQAENGNLLYREGYNSIVKEINKIIISKKIETESGSMWEDYKKGIEEALRKLDEI